MMSNSYQRPNFYLQKRFKYGLTTSKLLNPIGSEEQRKLQLKGNKRRRNRRIFLCVCGEEYLELTEEIQYWIGCDKCSSWFHCECVGKEANSIPEVFHCSKCSK